jgi:tRNA dimethylallyltransferase
LYDRINKRVDTMMEQGQLDEVETLLPYRELNALQTVGYQELFDYLEGKKSLEKAVEEIKQNTRRFAKRQLTWFRKNTETHWFEPQQVSQINALISKKLKT